VAAAHEAERQAHSAQRIRVEHGISHLTNRRALSRHLGRREHLDTILPAIAGLVFARNEHPDLSSSAAHRGRYRPARPGDRTRPGQVRDRPPLTMHEVVRTPARAWRNGGWVTRGRLRRGLDRACGIGTARAQKESSLGRLWGRAGRELTATRSPRSPSHCLPGGSRAVAPVGRWARQALDEKV
jgi:hypothetical protein